MIETNDRNLVAIVSYFLYGFNCECHDSDKAAVKLLNIIDRYVSDPQAYELSDDVVKWREDLILDDMVTIPDVPEHANCSSRQEHCK